MAKHPTKSQDDDDFKFESTQHLEDRKSKIHAEAEDRREVEQAEAARVAENQEISNFRGLPREGETRDQLLTRIRKMRDDKPKEVATETFRPPSLQKQFEAEQEAGRAAVAKATEEMEYSRAARQKAEAGEKNQAR